MADNFEKIIEKIIGDAEEKADQIVTEASLRSAATVSEAENQAEARYADVIEQANAEADRIRDRILSGFETAKRNRVLETKQDLIAACYQEAEQRLVALPASQKETLYKSWIARYGEDRPYTICLNRADLEQLGDALRASCAGGVFPGEPTVAAEGENISGGMLLRFGDVTKDISFRSQVEELRETTGFAVADILFEKGD